MQIPFWRCHPESFPEPHCKTVFYWGISHKHVLLLLWQPDIDILWLWWNEWKAKYARVFWLRSSCMCMAPAWAIPAHHVAQHAINYLLPLLDPPSTAVSIITAATARSITGTATARSIAAISIVATTAISIAATATTAHCCIHHCHHCHNHCCCIATISTTTNHHHCCHCHIHHHHYCIHCCHHCHYRFLSCCTLR